MEGYRLRYGRYPERILADRIYRNRETLSFCKENGIRLTGPALGRPLKDVSLSKVAKRQEYVDICDRNAIEGEFGIVKTAYGLGRVKARLEETSRCVIGIALLVMNLTKRLRSFLCLLYQGGFSLFFQLANSTRFFYPSCGGSPIYCKYPIYNLRDFP